MSKARKSPASQAAGLTFDALVLSIRDVDRDLATQTKRAVNLSVTLRNWLIGWHIEEYERRGADRGAYGDKLMDKLAEVLIQQGVSRCERRELYRYRTFYLAYPKIVETLSPQFKTIVVAARKSLRSAQPTGEPAIVESVSPQSGIAASELLSKLSFSHIAALLAIDVLEVAKKPVRCLEYIAVHELVHLLERNHTDRFTALMGKFLPGGLEPCTACA